MSRQATPLPRSTGWTGTRREWLARGAAGALAATVAWDSGHRTGPRAGEPPAPPSNRQALIAITLDLEMSRNFPRWEDTHWDYEKGNLDEATKRYTQAACRRVRDRGGVIHAFVVGRVLEQANVDWLAEIAAAGHPLGNHTYDHVYILARQIEELQFRFRRAPWLVEGRGVDEVVRENIRLTNLALAERLGVQVRGFRSPGGFAEGLSGREDVQQMLLDSGFTWASCRYPSHGGVKASQTAGQAPSSEDLEAIVAAQAQAQPFVYPSGLVEVPMSPVSDVVAFRTGRWTLEAFLEAIRRAVDWTIRQRAVFDFLAHPSCLGVVDPEFRTLDLICDLVEQAGPAAALVDLDTVAARARQGAG